MSATSWQKRAIAQLRAIEAATDGGLEVVDVLEPAEIGDQLKAFISVRCDNIEQTTDGIRYREREEFEVRVPAFFPYRRPSLYVSHRRWRGRPHVYASGYVCIYQAESEWQPSRGMYGFISRVDLWLERAAVGSLNAADVAIEPPVTTVRAETLVVAREDCPEVTDKPWLGYAELAVRDGRVDIVGWRTTPSERAAPAILLTDRMGPVFPAYVEGLLDDLAERGVPHGRIFQTLIDGAQLRDRSQPMWIVLGTPMRRAEDLSALQHLTVWEISPAMADALSVARSQADDAGEVAELRKSVQDSVIEWAETAKVSWCEVSEDRPEIVTRRDDRSPVADAFLGKRVVVWGCGAVGAPAAEWAVRAGASEVVLYDKDKVSPGILVRQPYVDEDVGLYKVDCLARRLEAIGRATVTANRKDLLASALLSDDWHDNADILIDATASASVRLRAEEANRFRPAPGATLAMMVGHDAERALAAVIPAGYPGLAEDVFRAAKLRACADKRLVGFADEFWPDHPRADLFQPEPGCSDATFRGSAVEVAGLTAILMRDAAPRLAVADHQAHAIFTALPSVEHPGTNHAEINVDASVRLPDSAGAYEIRLSATARKSLGKLMRQHASGAHPDDETGGVLFGRRDEIVDVIWIDEVGPPPDDSVSSPTRFDCGVKGVAEAVDQARKQSRDETGYIGLWHTHPNCDAVLSLVDVDGMFGLVHGHEDLPEALMLIVAGSARAKRAAAYVFVRDRAITTIAPVIVPLDRGQAAASSR